MLDHERNDSKTKITGNMERILIFEDLDFKRKKEENRLFGNSIWSYLKL